MQGVSIKLKNSVFTVLYTSRFVVSSLNFNAQGTIYTILPEAKIKWTPLYWNEMIFVNTVTLTAVPL